MWLITVSTGLLFKIKKQQISPMKIIKEACNMHIK